MLPIVIASFIGAPLTAALLWQQGTVIALALAPFGGSAAGLAVGLAVAAAQRREPAQPDRAAYARSARASAAAWR